MLFALIDVIQTPAGEVRGMPKWAWLAVVILVVVLGAALWFAFGHPWRISWGGGPPGGGGPPPQGPDDDPDFLRRLNNRRTGQA